ncbi:polysaccharide deacetylase family protein [Nonomuraea sp. NPDC003727]
MIRGPLPAEVELAMAGSAPGWPLVLYFHHVHPALEHYTSVTPQAFAHALETLLDEYGRPLDPGALSDLRALPAEPRFLITFDDGHRDTLEYALPILDRFGVKAVFFVITGPAGAEPYYHHGLLSWAELGGLRTAGHLIGAHTVTHRRLPELGADEQRHEITESLAVIRDRLAVASPPLAYPYGLVPSVPAVPSRTLAFGTVKAAPLPWLAAPHAIRRTYLPVGHHRLWPALCREWRDQWTRPSP